MPLRVVSWCSVSTTPQANDDKDSIPSQEAMNRSWAEQNNGIIVATLKVPGHSRDYLSINDCARDMEAHKITAFTELIDLWDQRSFDVLVCRDGSRFARTQALHAYVVEMTIKIVGARIYSHADGMIDGANFRMFTAMSGYKAASDNDTLVRYHRLGMNRLAQRGLHTSTKPPWSHRVIRDEFGKALRLELDESKLPLWRDLAILVLEGIAWNQLEREMAQRFGYVNPRTGKQYVPGKFYAILHNPYFWGHSGLYFKKQYGNWAFDPDEPLPPGAIIYRDTQTPVYTGDLAELIKAELRRSANSRGRSNRNEPHWFSGLVICDECKSKASASVHHRRSGKTDIYLRCNTIATYQYLGTATCTQKKTLTEVKLRTYIDSWLRQLITDDDWPRQFADQFDENNAAQITELEIELKRLNEEMLALIDKVSSVSNEVAQRAILKKIDQFGEQIQERDKRLHHLRLLVATDLNAARVRAFTEIRSMGIDAFWQLSPTRINQLLYTLLGNWRFRMYEGQVIGRLKYFRGKMR